MFETETVGPGLFRKLMCLWCVATPLFALIFEKKSHTFFVRKSSASLRNFHTQKTTFKHKKDKQIDGLVSI